MLKQNDTKQRKKKSESYELFYRNLCLERQFDLKV